MNKRIKAFTIMEVIISMLIASIAIGITYSVYNIVVKSYGSYNIKNKDVAGLARLDELLKKDFDHADIILKDQNGVLFKSADKTVSYIIDTGFIIRNSTIADTFKVKTQGVNLTFENLPLSDITEDEEANRVDELQFNLLVDDKKLPYHYYKQYSSANLIQRKNAIN